MRDDSNMPAFKLTALFHFLQVVCIQLLLPQNMDRREAVVRLFFITRPSVSRVTVLAGPVPYP